MHHLYLYIFREACRDTVEVNFIGVPSLWFYEDLMLCFF